MKRPNSSDSLPGLGLISMYPPSHEEEEEEEELCSHGAAHPGGGSEKKRRLSAEQVKALERSFEVENKLEPERKSRLAAELGLQPRQVAIWFQNRRARWKTKQLERDYGSLKASFDSLMASHDALLRDKDALLSEIKELKAKLAEDSGSNRKEENEAATKEVPEIIKKEDEGEEDEPREIESDSSDVLNEESLPIFESEELFRGFNWQCCYEPRNSRFGLQHLANHQYFKVEEEAYCDGFFSDEQPSTLPWWSS